MGKAEKLVSQAVNHLEPGELVVAAVMGAYETKILGSDSIRNGVLIATDRRVVFYATKLGGFDLESYPFGHISSFEHGKSLMGHHVTFFASGNKVSVKWLQPANEFAGFLDAVKLAMTPTHSRFHQEPSNQQSTGQGIAPQVDVMSMLKQLGDLRDAGIVTGQEFELKKAELLKRI